MRNATHLWQAVARIGGALSSAVWDALLLYHPPFSLVNVECLQCLLASVWLKCVKRKGCCNVKEKKSRGILHS